MNIEEKKKEILPAMIKLTKNDFVTQMLANNIVIKFNDLEFENFKKWLNFAEKNHYKNISKKFSIKV